MKIVTITGHKHTKKDYVAMKLAENSDVEFIQPYVDVELPKGVEPDEFDGYHIVLPAVMDDMIRDEEVISITEINGRRYVFFEFQITADYIVVIVDDFGLKAIKDKYKNVFTVLLKSKNQEPSERVLEFLKPSDFDVVFDVDTEDISDLEDKIAWQDPYRYV